MIILILIVVLIIYLFKSEFLQWIMFKINKNKIMKSTDSEIIKLLIGVLNEFGMKYKINFNNILLTFNLNSDNKIECVIYSWINDKYEKFPCQFIVKNDKNIVHANVIDRYKIIINMNVWKGEINYKIFNVEN